MLWPDQALVCWDERKGVFHRQVLAWGRVCCPPRAPVLPPPHVLTALHVPCRNQVFGTPCAGRSFVKRQLSVSVVHPDPVVAFVGLFPC